MRVLGLEVESFDGQIRPRVFPSELVEPQEQSVSTALRWWSGQRRSESASRTNTSRRLRLVLRPAPGATDSTIPLSVHTGYNEFSRKKSRPGACPAEQATQVLQFLF